MPLPSKKFPDKYSILNFEKKCHYHKKVPDKYSILNFIYKCHHHQKIPRQDPQKQQMSTQKLTLKKKTFRKKQEPQTPSFMSRTTGTKKDTHGPPHQNGRLFSL